VDKSCESDAGMKKDTEDQKNAAFTQKNKAVLRSSLSNILFDL